MSNLLGAINEAFNGIVFLLLVYFLGMWRGMAKVNKANKINEEESNFTENSFKKHEYKYVYRTNFNRKFESNEYFELGELTGEERLEKGYVGEVLGHTEKEIIKQRTKNF